MNIRIRLRLVFGAALAILFVVQLFDHFLQQQYSETSEDAQAFMAQSLMLARNIPLYFGKQWQEWQYLSQNDSGSEMRAMHEHEFYEANLQTRATAEALLPLIAQESELKRDVEQFLANHKKLETQYASLARGDDHAQSRIHSLSQDLFLLANIIPQAVERLKTEKETDAQQEMLQLSNLISVTSMSMGLTILMVTLLLVDSWLARPILYATRVAERIAKGNLSAPIDIKGSGESKHLLTALANMQSSLYRSKQTLLKTTQKLNDHNQKLDALYGISKLLMDQEKATKEVIQEAVELLPISWHHPDITGARITFDQRCFRSSEFVETTSMLSNPILVYGKSRGSVEVAQQKPTRGGGRSFLKEEKALIEAVARELANYIERKEAVEFQCRSEANLAAAQRIAHVGNWELNLVASEFSCSDEFYRIFGILPNGFDITYKEFLDAIHPDDRAFAEGAIHDALHNDKALDIEHRIVLPDGQESIVHERAAVTKDPDGNAALIIGTVQDITERKWAEEERKVMEAQLQQAQKLESIGQLAAGIAHEINTPTQFVSDNTRFLKESFEDLSRLITLRTALFDTASQEVIPPERLAELQALTEEIDLGYLIEEIPKAIDQSLDGLERISRIIHAMKEFSHPGVEEKTAIDINKAILSTLEVSRNEWKYNAEMVTELDPHLPPVPCFPGDFNQIILNVVVNGAQAITEALGQNSDHKGTLAVCTRQLDDWAEIRISDTGTGIPKESLPKIFDPFFTTKEVGKGTGQGLTIAYSAVEKHQGVMKVESEVGKGTIFTIRLPLALSKAS